jgi:hypothetical protein
MPENPHWDHIRGKDKALREVVQTRAEKGVAGGYATLDESGKVPQTQVVVPAVALTDGSPPSASPVPTVLGGVNSLFVSWAAVGNADLVTYEVHVSTSSGFTPSGATLAGETPGTLFVVRALPGTTNPPVYGTTYYVKLIAKDKDGAAAAGTQGSGTPARVFTTDLDIDVGGGNIVFNGSNERDSNGDGFADGRNFYSWPANPTTFGGNLVTGYFGAWAQRVFWTGGSTRQGIRISILPPDNTFPYRAGTYIFSAYIKGTAQPDALFGIGDFAFTFSWLANPTISATVFQRYVAKMDVPADSLGHAYIASFAASGEMIIDGIQLERGNLATAWAPRPDELLAGSVGLAALTSGVQTGLADDADNMLVNGSFEQSSNGLTPDGWAGGGLNIDESVTHGSGRSARIDGSAADTYEWQDVALEANVVYELSGWIKTSALPTGDAGQGAVLNVDIQTGGGSFTIVEQIGDVFGGGEPDVGLFATGAARDWTFVRSRFIRSTAGLSRVFVQLGYGGGQSGQAWYDGLVLRRMPILAANDIAANAITAAKIAAGAIVAGKIAADAVGANEIAANSITTSELAADAVTATKIAAGSVVAGKVAADAIGANEIAAGAITAAELAANSVTAAKIAANAITAGKLEAVLVLASKLIAGAVGGGRVEVGEDAEGNIGIRAFASDGSTPTFVVDGQTGQVYAKGRLDFGGGSHILTDDTIEFLQQPAGSWQIPAAVQSQAAISYGDSTPSVGWPSPYTPGNLLLLSVTNYKSGGAATITTPSGWTAVGAVVTQGNMKTNLYYRSAPTSGYLVPQEVTLSAAPDIAILEIFEYSGVQAVLDKTATANANTEDPTSGTTATTTQSDELLFAILAHTQHDDGTPYFANAPINSFSLVRYLRGVSPSVAGLGVEAVHRFVTSTGAYGTGDALTGAAGTWGSDLADAAGIIATFKAKIAAVEAASADHVRLYAKSVSSVPRLYVVDDDGTDAAVVVGKTGEGWKLELVSVTRDIGSVAAHSGGSYAETIPGLAVGDYCFFMGASAGANVNSFVIRTQPICGTAGQITVDYYNSHTAGLDPASMTHTYLVIHRG